MTRLWSEINAINDPIFISGNTFTVKGRKFRVIDKPHDDPFRWLIAPAGWHYWWSLVVYRLRQSFRRTGQFIVIILSIWGLADWDSVTRPTWDCILLLRWMSRKISTLRNAS